MLQGPRMANIYRWEPFMGNVPARTYIPVGNDISRICRLHDVHGKCQGLVLRAIVQKEQTHGKHG